MRAVHRTRFVLFLITLAPVVSNVAVVSARVVARSAVLSRTAGHGSLQGMLLRDGTVCTTSTDTSLDCTPLMRLGPELAEKFGTGLSAFDGIFDLDGSGAPQIFMEYTGKSNDPGCREYD